jgi:hypothetical protein
MLKNKIGDLRNLLFAQLERLSDDDCDIEKETTRAKAMAQIAVVIVNSAKVEIDFLKMHGNEGAGTGFIPIEAPRD